MKKYVSLMVLFALAPITSAFAIDYYGTIPLFFQDGEPTVCYSDYEKDDHREFIIKQSIDNWQNGLKEHTKNLDAWNINYQYISNLYTEIFEKQSMVCDIAIIFSDDVENAKSGNTELLTTRQILITISTLHEFSDKDLKMVIEHELGHALGLDHYVTNDFELMQQWDQSINVPSIMVAAAPEHLPGITELDLKKMVSIYGNDGFEKLPPVLPDWIQNVFKWYGENLVSDQELVNAIQYLVQNGIIMIS